MRKTDFEPVQSDDIVESKQLPWFTKILSPLNRMFEYVKEAFDSNIALNNLKIQEIEVTGTMFNLFPKVFPYSVLKTRKEKVKNVVLGQVVFPKFAIPNVVMPLWHEQNQYIVIENIIGLDKDPTFVRLLVFYET